MKYTTKQIEDAANKLRALPAKKRAKNPSSKKAVQMLQTEFAALLDRGYSLAQAGRALHKAGIQISPLTVLESLGGPSLSPRNRTPRTKSTQRAPAKPRAAKSTSVPEDRPSTPPSPAVAKSTSVPEDRPSTPPSPAVAKSTSVPEDRPSTRPSPAVAKSTSVPEDRPSTPPSPAAAEAAPRIVRPPLLPSLPPLPPPPPRFPKLQRAPASPPTQPNQVFQRGNRALPKASFPVRPDTPDSEL